MKKRIFQKFYNRFLSGFNRYLMTINFTAKVFKIEEGKKALCIAPHPDDESIGMGGVLAKYKNNFDVICLTDGAKGIKNLNVEEVVQTRKIEFENALKVAGIENFKNLGIADREVCNSYDKFSEIEIEKYDYIFIPNLIDTHYDHRACFIHLQKMLREKKHKSNLKILFYEVWGTLTSPNVLVNITEVVQIKAEMIKCYKSQLERKDYLGATLGLNKYRGLTKNIEYSEAFWLLDCKEVLRLYDEFFSDIKEQADNE